MGLLTVAGVVAGYSAADEILKGVDLEVHPGEIVSIIGPNGAGKSTLLKAIAGILKPSRGTIVLNGDPIHGRPPREIARHGLAFVLQEHNVFGTLSVRENLEFFGRLFGLDRAGRDTRIAGPLAASTPACHAACSASKRARDSSRLALK